MENKTKTATYLGFAIKAGKIKTGANAVATLKRASLVIVCKTASENTVDVAKSLARKLSCPILKTQSFILSDYLHKENAKVTAVTDNSLAKAIISQTEKDFIELN